MHHVRLVAAAALLIPAIGLAQGDGANRGQKAKAWLVSNFRSFDCALSSGSASALTGGGTVSFDASGDGGIDLAVTSGEGGVPTITAHAINTKGTGAAGRTATQSCRSSNTLTDSSAPACSVSGDAQSPTVNFTVPLSALGDPAAARNYVGTVTIVKRASGETMTGKYLSKKGYDYYQAQGDMAAAKGDAGPGLLVIASCDSAKLTAKGSKPMAASYDLAVAKK